MGLFKKLKKIVKPALTVASVVPGPWQVPALATNAGLSLAKGDVLGAALNGVGAYGAGGGFSPGGFQSSSLTGGLGAGAQQAGYTLTGDAIKDMSVLRDMGYAQDAAANIISSGGAGSYVNGINAAGLAAGGLGNYVKPLIGAAALIGAGGAVTRDPGYTQSAQSADLDNLFSTFIGGGGVGDTSGGYTPPVYEDDPTGLVAKYQSDYLPYNQKLMDQVDLYNSDGYRAQQRAAAMADVQQQSDAALQAQQRGLLRSGVNPASGRALALSNQNAISTAAGKVQAALQSDRSLMDTYQKGLASIGLLGKDVAGLGLDATKNKSVWNLGQGELGLKAQTQNQDNAYKWGSLATQKYGYDKGITTTQLNNQALADRQTNSNLWGIGGLLAKSVLTPNSSGGSGNGSAFSGAFL